MISAGKIHMIAGLKLGGVQLRQAELDFYINRYIACAGAASLLSALGYVGIIKIKIPEPMQEEGFHWQSFAFYTCSSSAMALSLLTLACSGFLVVNAQGLMLRGPPDSVQRCVVILSGQWNTVRVLLALSVLAILGCVVIIAWMKLDDLVGTFVLAGVVTAVVGAILCTAVSRMTRIYHELSIPDDQLVLGDLKLGAARKSPGVDLIVETSHVIPVKR